MTIDPRKLESFTATLVAISGSAHVQNEGGVLRVAPATTDEIAAILRSAREHGVTVSAYGGGTKQSWGSPSQTMLELRTTRLNTVREHPWQDMTCTVEAGSTWAAMQAELAKHGQFVALDPLYPEQATIAGVVAVNDSGSLRLKYGSLRDLIIGMTIVLADGTIARTGGKVVKNVAGYDLHKLMTGAFGTLGVITEITFRLHSIPRHTRSFTVAAENAEPLGRMLLAILDSHLSTESMQLRAEGEGFHLDVKLVALPEVVEAQANTLLEMAGKEGLASAEATAEVWSARQKHFDGQDGLIAKITMLSSEIAEMTTAVQKMGGSSVTQSVGVMIATVPGAAAAELLELRKRVETRRGSVMILRQNGEKAFDVWGMLPDTVPVMREIKQRFDPYRILNPGRFLGGI